MKPIGAISPNLRARLKEIIKCKEIAFRRGCYHVAMALCRLHEKILNEVKNNFKEDIEAVLLCILTIGAVALFVGYPLWQIAAGKI